MGRGGGGDEWQQWLERAWGRTMIAWKELGRESDGGKGLWVAVTRRRGRMVSWKFLSSLIILFRERMRILFLWVWNEKRSVYFKAP